MAVVFLILSFASVVCLILGLMRPSDFKVKSRGSIIKIFGGAFILSFVGLGIAAVNTDYPKEEIVNESVLVEAPKSVTKNPDMNLEVGYSLTEKGFAVPVLTVKNLNDFKWEECMVTINDKYTKTIDPILRPKDFEITGGRGYHTMASIWFTAKDGSIFNPSTTRPVSVFVKCNKPYSAHTAFSFKN